MRCLPVLVGLWMAGAAMTIAPDAQSAPAESMIADPTADHVAVLGLDTNDPTRGMALTTALRRAVDERGFPGAAEATLSEIRLTGGCIDNAPACLAQGSKLVGGDQVVFGRLDVPQEGSAHCDLYVLDVAAETTRVHTTMAIALADLEPATIDGTAQQLLAALFPVPPPTDDRDQTTKPTRSAAPLPAESAESERKFVWGGYSPRPRWKWVLFGVSLGTTVAAISGAIATTVSLRREDANVIDAAAASREGGNAGPAISESATGVSAICDEAGAHPSLENPQAVFNRDVATICKRRALRARIATGLFVVGGVAAAASLTSVVLLFVHRATPARAHLTPEISPVFAGLRLSGRF